MKNVEVILKTGLLLLVVMMIYIPGQGLLEKDKINIDPIALTVRKQIKSMNNDISLTYTKGDCSYIPINLRIHSLHSRNELILRVTSLIDAFKIAHPKLEITGWEIDKYEESNSLSLFGIRVRHKAKTFVVK
jgi:hypothetical protein